LKLKVKGLKLNENKGNFITLNRKILEWEWFPDSEVFRVFVTCLLLANFKDKKYRGHDILKGSFVMNFVDLALKLELSTRVLRDKLKKLESTGEITTKTVSHFTIITICNYCTYQEQASEVGKSMGKSMGKPMGKSNIGNPIDFNDLQTPNKETRKQGNNNTINSIKKDVVFEGFVAEFNNVIGVIKCRKSTDTRIKKYKKLRSKYQHTEFEQAYQNIINSNFLQTGFKVDIDWFINENNFVKILEGKYNGNRQINNKSNKQQLGDRIGETYKANNIEAKWRT
jgi:hypothetical protein